ncbi:MAG TPA: sensor domain-containing diguanylate cyclase, partial [Devosia sp.]
MVEAEPSAVRPLQAHQATDTSVELRRLGVLNELGIIAGADPGIDQICALAGDIFGMPIAVVTLLDKEHQWLKARQGVDIEFLPRETAFCNFTILADDVLVVPDASLDERFASNPLVVGEPHIRFYAGAPLEWEPGIRLGALCVIDSELRAFSDSDRRRLAQLAELVVAQIRLHSVNTDLQKKSEQLVARQSALEWTATHDALTGLPNRTLFRTNLEKALTQTATGQTGAVLIVDLDEFKRINDTMGHEAGDVLLVAIGERLSEIVRAPNMVARLGGDEFGILLTGNVSNAQLKSLSDGIYVALHKPVEHERFSFYCSASMGQVLFPEHASTATGIMRCADIAL